MKFVKELLFGDYIKPYVTDGAYETITVKSGTNKGEYIKVHCRNVDGYIKKSEIQEKRILEVNFIDVGQGDGCHIATPDDKHILIDAGKGKNMYRYLRWRFNLNRAKAAPPPFTVVISHSDTDHYQGFGSIFSKTKGSAQQFTIKKVYHNGMLEGVGANLGPEVTKDGKTYIEANVYDYLGDFRDGIITSDILGCAFEPEQRFENPDGTEIIFDRDYFGDHRGTDALPGPFACEEQLSRALW